MPSSFSYRLDARLETSSPIRAFIRNIAVFPSDRSL